MSKVQKYLSVLALSLAGGSIYLIPYIRYVFYDHQMAAMGITNQQIGLLSTVFGIGAMILYAPGGIVVDRLSTKKCLLVSLIATTILTVTYAFCFHSYIISLVIWFLLSISTVFVFWSALIKTIRLVGNSDEQGFIFGLYYMGNGLTGAAVNGIAIWAFRFNSDVTQQFFNAVLIYAAATTVAAIAVFFLVKEEREKSEALKINEFRMDQVMTLLKNPVVWVFSLIIFAGYSVYSSTSYFTPYLTNVVGLSAADSGVLSILRTYIFYIITPFAGIFCDKVFKSTSKFFTIMFLILAALFAGVMAIPATAGSGIVSFYSLLPGLFGLALYGISFSIATETKIPIIAMGTAVGIASVIGYTPDFFMATMFGTWLDNHGNAGYNYIFTFLAAVCVIGAVASFYVRKKSLVARSAGAEATVSETGNE